ncbi:LacI family DNA-binding transcriptional regulator [Acidimangrovimonas sediminis]|uniref:LacI family DNA-binding transcriptional regulator n=1 Tax=Acidimangrovimonas sediminis TaxID=2056283 RepID=UPI000C80C081|nr:LacI family DNA-binding transcriptional regulator [Acidimangrovimonas sediminis]
MTGGKAQGQAGGGQGGRGESGEVHRGRATAAAPARRVTIYDVALRAGVSGATVSLVLNGSWERYRIRRETAEAVLALAAEMGYRPNRRARDLRRGRSSLAGMVLPHYRNRFFAGIAEAFEAAARARGLCPVVVSAQRDSATETWVAETLVAQQVELLVICGVADPAPLNALCAKTGIPCVNLDLPGPGAPSVVTDNAGGSRRLTEWLIAEVAARGGDPSGLRFIGGVAGEFATEGRMQGFRAALEAAGLPHGPGMCAPVGYPAAAVEAEIRRLHARPGGLPAGLFINSLTALEGYAAFLRDHHAACAGVPVACWDWDPFGAVLPVDLAMVWQDVPRMVAAAFELFDTGGGEPGQRVVIPPQLFLDPRAAPVNEAGPVSDGVREDVTGDRPGEET